MVHTKDSRIKQLVEQLLENTILNDVARENEEAKHILREIESEEGWELCADKDDIQTYYRKEENEKLHALKIQGTIDSPMFDVISIFYEVDLYKTWMPRMTLSRILKQYGRVCSHFALISHKIVSIFIILRF
jgi:hypothetical protein